MPKARPVPTTASINKEDDVYVVYLKNGGTTSLDLSQASGSFEVKWYDPRNGSSLKNGSVTSVNGGGSLSLGNAPNSTSSDWAILVQRDVRRDPIFLEAGGLIIMEAESTESPMGKWINKTSVANYTGASHIEFTGNGINGGNPDSPLVYKFKVAKAGVYKLLLRCHKRLEGADSDKCNDAYVRLEGDYTAASGAPIDWLTTDTKLYGGSATGWGWSAQLDVRSVRSPGFSLLPEATACS